MQTQQDWEKRKPIWKIELCRYTKELEIYCIPPWIGFSYYHFDTDVSTYHLIPFNRIIRALKDLLYWIRWGKAKEELFAERLEVNKRSYDKGFADGEKVGYEKGLLIYQDLMHKATK